MDPLTVLRDYCKSGKLGQVVMSQKDDPRPVVYFGSEWEYDRRKPIALMEREEFHELDALVHLLKLRQSGPFDAAKYVSHCRVAGVKEVNIAEHDVRSHIMSCEVMVLAAWQSTL
jgi:hypothetical protein